ncbi:MAG: SWIM zinc finger family protein [Chloroflexi bacterium]|nr:SWIM zinc finger family protein [Chloroflexota bacterium]
MAKRSSKWYPQSYGPSHPREAHGGIRARSSQGAFARNWWAQRWLEAMEALVDPRRLQRGRTYARHGQVLSIVETKNGVEARVQGSRAKPYLVTIRVKPLTGQQWDRVVNALSAQAIFTAQLLSGEMPAEIEEAFSAADVSLFPRTEDDLETTCSCPDWANPCKHVAAVHYILGDRFDEDPFLLFRLRGRTQEQVMKALRQRRSGGREPRGSEGEEEPEAVLPLDQRMDDFWQAGEGLARFQVNLKIPEVHIPLLRRLGEPDFAGNTSLQVELSGAYEAIMRAALELAYTDDGGNGAAVKSQTNGSS